MKLEKITHDHLLTKWLKVIIFSLLMLAPIFSIAVRCAYVVCNKNAYQSYYGETINDKQLINTTTLEQNKSYYINNTSLGTQATGGQSNKNYFFTNGEVLNNNNYQFNEGDYFRLYISTIGNIEILVFDVNNVGTSKYDIYITRDNLTFKFDYITTTNYGSGIFDLSNYNNLFYFYEYNNYSYLDNVFDYSVAQLKQDQLFNWTQNTAVYTGVNAMTTGLGMNDGTIAILLTYWMLLTIIYVIIDIVLAGFTMLTHMIYNKKVD